MAKLAVKQPPPPADEIPVEVIADALVSISDGIKKLRAGSLNEKALQLLIQHAIPAANRPSTKQIQAVLDGAESLKSLYLKR
jgi:hypothetical protein